MSNSHLKHIECQSKAKRENSRTSMLCPSQRKYENNTRREFTRQNEELGVGQFV